MAAVVRIEPHHLIELPASVPAATVVEYDRFSEHSDLLRNPLAAPSRDPSLRELVSTGLYNFSEVEAVATQDSLHISPSVSPTGASKKSFSFGNNMTQTNGGIASMGNSFSSNGNGLGVSPRLTGTSNGSQSSHNNNNNNIHQRHPNNNNHHPPEYERSSSKIMMSTSKSERGLKTSRSTLNVLSTKIGGQLGELVGRFARATENKITPVSEEDLEAATMSFSSGTKAIYHQQHEHDHGHYHHHDGDKKPRSLTKKRSARALIGSGSEEDAEKSAFKLVMLLATLLALWGSDVYEFVNPGTSSDMAWYTIIVVVFFLFVVEFLFYSLFRPGYIGSFFFALDFISAFSMIPDALMLWNLQVMGSGGGSLALARAGKAARAGTRAARVVRIFKLFSILWKKGKDGGGSKIGTLLRNRVMNKVILIVALMLISSNMLDLVSTASGLSDQVVDITNDLDALEELFVNTNRNVSSRPFLDLTAHLIDSMNFHPDPTCPGTLSELYSPLKHDTHGCTVRYLRINGVDVWGSAAMFGDLRTYPSEVSRIDSGLNSIVIATVADAKSEALVNICIITFITVLLGISYELFNRDSDRLVIIPLEFMTMLVRNLIKDPLNTVDMDKEDAAKLGSETKTVVMAIQKLSQMLQVGFGAAGGGIIQAAMASDGSDINPVIPGHRIQAIYGFCDIRNFTDCTECLQQDVMVFVNRISDFVHRAVKENEGAPNKNIGDAFLLVWKLPEIKFGVKNKFVTTADSALKSFVRIIIETAADPQLQELTNRKAVQDRIPGYAVKMGFGLHSGWGIEGAIGSILKIDATYLSPNVNMSARLEGATKAYGCVMLMTESFFDLLTPTVQKLCRRVDRVTARGSNVPFDLFTFDAVRYPDVEVIQAGTTFWERFPPTTTVEFRFIFGNAVKLYIDGKWTEAKPIFQECLKQLPNDGPTKYLYSTLEENGFKCPASWPGYRLNGVD